MKNRLEDRRRFVVPATALALVISLIGGLLVLGLPVKRPAQQALKPVEPPAVVTPTEPPSSADADLSMFGFGGTDITSGDMASSSSSLGLPGGSSAGLLPTGGSGGLPSVALPPPGTPGEPGPGFDWNALLDPLIQAQLNAQSANVAGSIVGSTTGVVAAALNSAAVIIGDLLLFAAVTNNGPNVLNQLQSTLATAMPAAAAAMTAAGMPPVPVFPDMGNLTTAFAAAAPLGVTPLPQLPSLPTPDQVAASLAGLSALSALPALPAISLPGLPPPPQLPRPEEVVGGAVAIGVGIVAVPLVLSLLLPPPPSITRMLGLPF